MYRTGVEREVDEDLFNRGLCLPSGTAMTQEELDRVVSIIKRCHAETQRRKGGYLRFKNKKTLATLAPLRLAQDRLGERRFCYAKDISVLCRRHFLKYREKSR
jgi:hypothetical protein